MNLSQFQQPRIPQTLDTWNPQEEDFKSTDFNCYDRGPGKDLPKNSQKHVQLYVQGIPNEMSEDGLRNLFMKAGTVMKVVKMMSKKPGALDTYGFITMSNVREADEAIRRFNYFKINQFMLKVRISVSLEERQRQQQKKQEEEEFFQSLKTSQAWAPISGINSGADSNKGNRGSYHQSIGYGFSSAEPPHSSPKYGLGRGGFPKGYQGLYPVFMPRGGIQQSPGNKSTINYQLGSVLKDSAKVGPSGDGQMLHGAGSTSSLHNPHVLRDSFPGQENPQFNNQWSPNHNYPVEGLKITIGKSDSLNQSRHVLPTEETMLLRHHSSNQYYTGSDPGLMQQGRVLGQDRFAPAFGRGRKPAMGRGYNHYSQNSYDVGRGRGFQKLNYYGMPAPEAFCDHGQYGPSSQSYAVQPGLVNVPSYINTGLYMPSPYLLQAAPVTPPKIQMQSPAAANMEDTRSVAEKSTRTVKLEPRECTNCMKIGTFQCKRCKIPYCCTDCQKQDWPRHKTFCSKIKEMQDTDEFKDFDVTFGEDLVDNVKTLIEKHTGDAVVVDKSSLEKACNVQQQQNRKSEKPTGKTGSGDQSGKVKEKDAQNMQPRSNVADNNKKDFNKSSGKEAMNNQSGLKNQNRSPQKNRMTKTQSEDYNRGKERNDQPGNQNRRGGADRRNDVQKYQSRNKQDGKTDANEQEWEDVSNKEQFRNTKTGVSATMQTVPKPLSRNQPGSYPHPVADNSKQSSGSVFVSELPSVLSEVKVGEELEVIITAHESPANFTVQIIQLERIQMFSTFSDKLNELYDEEKEPYRPGKVGELVVARYSLDQKWYRAEVRELTPSTVSLSFIDFGNEEDASYSQIRKAKPVCREVASQSLKCCLIGMESQTITKDDIEEFGRRLKQIADPRQGRILFTVKAIAKGYVLVDAIDVESNRSLAAVMSERFSSKKTRTQVSSAERLSSPVTDIKVFELKCDGSSSLGLIVYITGLDSFHIQPQDEASKSQLESLMLQIQQYCSSMLTPYMPVIGEIVCAMFSDDNLWYRAQVKKKVEKDIYSVCFVDYGNHANINVSYIRVLEKKFTVLPCMGIPCRLAGLRDKDNQDILREFVTMVINTVVKVKAVRFRDGFYEVEISLTDGTSVNEKIGCVMSTANKGEVRKAEARAAAVSERIMAADVPSQQLPVNFQVSVDLIELESLSCFYLKRMDIYDEAEFQELETEIGKYCVSNIAAYTPVVGELVAAKFTNNKWYRANVLQVGPSTCDVIFTDYGNQDMVENCNVRKLRKEFTKLPFVAIKCKLSGIQAATDEAKLLSFAKDVIGQKIKGQAIAIDKNGVTEVKLFSLDGSCINDRVALTDQKVICGSPCEVQEPLRKESKTEIVIMAKDVRPVELPTDGSRVEVEVVEILLGLEYFFVKTVDDASRVKLDSQQIEINILCKEDSTEYTPVVDELVAALFEGVWYRGKVVEGDGNSFNILYVDFGNVCAVTRNQIRKLNTRFADLPFMAIPCRLQGLSQPVTQDMLLAFAGDVVEKRVLLESHGFVNGVMEVVLFTDNGTCINKKLGLQVSSLIVPTSLTTTILNTVPTSDTTSYVHQEEEKSAVMASDVQPYTLTVDGAGVEVEVLVVHGLTSFYVQVTEENQQCKLKNLMTEMAGFCSSSAISYKPQVGEMVVAQYYEDKMWYRARVDGVQNGVFDVFYVDYGNMEQMQASSLRKFEPMFGTLPQMAVHCKLSYTGTEDDSDLRIARFAQEVLMKRVLMKVTGYVDGKYEVVIYLSDGTTIQSILGLEKKEKVLVATQIPICSGGVARHMADQMMKVDLPEDGSFIDAVVFEMKRLDSFYIQKRSEEVQRLLEQIEEYCNKQTSRYEPVIGELVCAKFSQDNLWYRARVDELIEEGVYRVLFVDYGNSDIVSEEMMIKCDDIIFSVPQQGIHCKLSEVGAVQMDEKLQAIVSSLVNVLVKVRVVKCISGVYEVQLYTGDGSACLNNELMSLINSEEAEENTDTIIAPAIFATASASSDDIKPETSRERLVVLAKDFPRAEPFGSEFGIVITSVVDPRCFYCQLADEEVVSVFGEMMDRLSEHCQSEPALPDAVYTEGELCCAKFPADGKWYRACILQLNPNGTALVFYVDFGNEEVVSLEDLNSLSKEFQTLPILALRCSLSGLHPTDGAWRPEAVNVLKSLQEQVLRVKLVEVFDNTYHLIVLHTREGGDTVSLNQILVEAGLAQQTPVRQSSPALAESTEIDPGVEKSHSSSQASTPDEDVTANEELILQEIEALKAKYNALKMKGNN
ncbi:hypothetical protein ACJMK2_006792 [Sinanodonta woodiana]|uniref:Tudor domain-containing protein 1 n=1 Tax=Sinanodonta woodiana TaxID=1069815 RepID=A0ABD3VU85_SINWO